jgi:hypothetical protein
MSGQGTGVNEPATALTDFLLALLAVVFLFKLLRRPHASLRVGAPLFFAGFAMAAVLGGVAHGFMSDDGSLLYRVTWWSTLVFTCVAACGLAAIGLEGLGWHDARGLVVGCGIFVCVFAVYAWSDSRFLVAVVVTGAGSVLCLVGLARHARRARAGAALAAAGLLISIVASVLQQSGLALHPVHFDHNATYHLFLVPALTLLYVGNRRIATRNET